MPQYSHTNHHSTYKLNHHLDIKENTNDGTIDPSPEDWKSVCTPWAEKQGLTGNRFFQAAQAQYENSVIFTIFYTPANAEKIKQGMQVVDGKDTLHPYEIIAEPVDYNDEHKWLEIHAKRIGNGN